MIDLIINYSVLNHDVTLNRNIEISTIIRTRRDKEFSDDLLDPTYTLALCIYLTPLNN